MSRAIRLAALLFASGLAHADPTAEPAARATPGHVTSASGTPGGTVPRDERLIGLGFGAELGGSPALFGGKAGIGELRGGGEAVARRWMGWFEVDGTDRFRPGWPADAGRTDRVVWLFPHLEYSQQLARRSLLFGWAHAGPTIGNYHAGEGSFWFPGLAVGAGVQWALLRVGVRYYGQWRQATVSAGPGASGDVRLEPMIFLTAGLELFVPAVPSRATRPDG